MGKIDAKQVKQQSGDTFVTQVENTDCVHVVDQSKVN